MLKTLLISTLQCMLLCLGQVFLKLGLTRAGEFRMTWRWMLGQLTNWPLLASGLSMMAATALWLYILKRTPFSVAYPLTGISYAFGMIASVYIFHETVSTSRWTGVALVVAGVILITKQA
ncbi:MAG: EamA family transporter [Tannerellaceae bacterium]|jgi:drug/metabolite transporter (DMT)-like permease|nr:EamA family transporter [Tannerellaceae bacterium]